MEVAVRDEQEVTVVDEAPEEASAEEDTSAEPCAASTESTDADPSVKPIKRRPKDSAKELAMFEARTNSAAKIVPGAARDPQEILEKLRPHKPRADHLKAEVLKRDPKARPAQWNVLTLVTWLLANGPAPRSSTSHEETAISVLAGGSDAGSLGSDETKKRFTARCLFRLINVISHLRASFIRCYEKPAGNITGTNGSLTTFWDLAAAAFTSNQREIDANMFPLEPLLSNIDPRWTGYAGPAGVEGGLRTKLQQEFDSLLSDFISAWAAWKAKGMGGLKGDDVYTSFSPKFESVCNGRTHLFYLYMASLKSGLLATILQAGIQDLGGGTLERVAKRSTAASTLAAASTPEKSWAGQDPKVYPEVKRTAPDEQRSAAAKRMVDEQKALHFLLERYEAEQLWIREHDADKDKDSFLWKVRRQNLAGLEAQITAITNGLNDCRSPKAARRGTEVESSESPGGRAESEVET